MDIPGQDSVKMFKLVKRMKKNCIWFLHEGSGNNLGLTVILNGPIDEYYCSMTNGFGYRVLLHSPNELPRVHHWGIEIANGYESRIITTPILSRASKSVRKIDIQYRKCLFENENFLSLYR